MNRCWKEAASIIVASRSKILPNCRVLNKSNGQTRENHDYEILVLKRGKTSKFFPGGYVFPGGTVEETDCSEEWRKLHDLLGFNSDYLNSLISESPHTPIFNNGSALPKAISLRITAIRETFEESGILLCKKKTVSKHITSAWASFLTGSEVLAWQKTVQNNPNEFINLCKEFECFPDVWSMHQWSNWLTPTNNPIRFDTAFFLTTTDQLPPFTLNEQEMDDIKWCTPNGLLNGTTSESLWLPPPQYYEISRIVNFKTIDQLNKFALQRTRNKCERWMPVQIQTDDGIVTLLPGDDAYPVEIDCNKKDKLQKFEGTMEKLRKDKSKLHRMELYGTRGLKIFTSNVEPTCGHLIPFHH